MSKTDPLLPALPTATAIPFSMTGGPYGEGLHRAVVTMATYSPRHDALLDAARMLDLLISVSSESTLSLALRTLRDREAPSPTDVEPCTAALREAAARLERRDENQDYKAAMILTLLADSVSERTLDTVLAIVAHETPVRRRKAA